MTAHLSGDVSGTLHLLLSESYSSNMLQVTQQLLIFTNVKYYQFLQ